MTSPSLAVTCPGCRATFQWASSSHPHFCPYCAHLLVSSPLSSETTELGQEWLPARYQLIRHIGKGGMGEVFLAFDTLCQRQIAIKKIRSDLLHHPTVRRRFLKEAYLTCQLTHPAIIPIYSIQSENLSAYYTMPFVEGETLKQLIRLSRQREKEEAIPHHLGDSIPALIRIFVTICQAVAYAHSRGVLHRDLKPENMIVGKYGEVLILDWGLAKTFHSADSVEEPSSTCPLLPQLPSDMTRIGKVVGTVAYMSPERALGQPATIQSDIYALGVILYQLLTLKPPFKRGTLEEFRRVLPQEQWINPIVAAPHRDVPQILARATEKCLHTNPQERYQLVEELIRDLETYLEGRSEWFPVAELDIKRKSDWEFQEHVLIAEHAAVTRVTEGAEWVNLMISQGSFNGNVRLETSIRIGEGGHGIGFLLSVPEPGARTHLHDGYCLWLGAEHEYTTKLLRSHLELVHAPEIFLKREEWIHIRIEQVEQRIHLYLNGTLQLSYSALIPLIGTHIGVLARDDDFSLTPLYLSVGSLNLTISCLAVPNAFLAHRHFECALSEYRRIAYSFPDRTEGREALFRAGLTFLEQAKEADTGHDLIDQALKEFEKLHHTPSAPLEYLGKALVYQYLHDDEEEVKCFELAYRRYPKHPLLSVLREQILSRMHDVSRHNRIATYRFLLLAIRHFPTSVIDTHSRRLFVHLQRHWEPLDFLEDPSSLEPTHLATTLAFWLAKPYVLGEIIEEVRHSTTSLYNACVCLLQLGAWEYAQKIFHTLTEQGSSFSSFHRRILEYLLACHTQPIECLFSSIISSVDEKDLPILSPILLYAIDRAIDAKLFPLIHQIAQYARHRQLSPLLMDIRELWAFLSEENWQGAATLLERYSLEQLSTPSSLLHFLYGCWLQATEGQEVAMVHFSALLHTPYPRSWTLASHELLDDLTRHGWLEKSFLWEKRQLYHQLALYYRCAGSIERSQYFLSLYHTQWLFPHPT